MQLTKREKIGLIMFSIIIVFFISLKYFNKIKKEDTYVIKGNNEESFERNDVKNTDIEVYICGAIKNPGVYKLQQGDRLVKLIEKAGGTLNNADLNSINLSIKLKDEDYIRIPEKIVVNINGAAAQTSSSFGNNKININIADIEELKKLPRIGDALGQRIIDYREKNGPFKDIKDIKKVSGIGDKMFENIKEKISIY